MVGTFVNAATILVGSTLGVIFHAQLPDRFIKIVFQGLGLFTLYLGVSMAGKTDNMLIMVFSVVLGGIVGEAIRLDERLEQWSEWARTRLKVGNEKFSEGAITAFLLFCMGSMTVLGAIEDGLGQSSKLLITKSVLDGFAAIALASAYGAGVAFSVVPLLLFQGGITLLARYLGSTIDPAVVNEMTAVGGLLLIGLGITMLEIKKLKVLNLLPALVVAILIAYLLPLVVDFL